MFDLIYLMLTAAGVAAPTADCPDNRNRDGQHLSSICDASLDGATAYSATYQASLAPWPASQQVLIYRKDARWFIRIAGYRWTRGAEVVTRRREMPLLEPHARRITSQMTVARLERLSKRPYYGSDTVICTDGAQYALAMSAENQRHFARQHSCAGKTELDEIAALFREIAIEYDPEFDGLLTGLGK